MLSALQPIKQSGAYRPSMTPTFTSLLEHYERPNTNTNSRWWDMLIILNSCEICVLTSAYQSETLNLPNQVTFHPETLLYRSANCEVAFMHSSFKPPCGNNIISGVDSYETVRKMLSTIQTINKGLCRTCSSYVCSTINILREKKVYRRRYKV